MRSRSRPIQAQSVSEARQYSSTTVGREPGTRAVGALTRRLQQYDGVVLGAVGLDMADLERIHPDLPIVLFGEQDVPDRYHRVQMGNVAGARLATEHLIAWGATRIAVLRGKLTAPHPEMATHRAHGWSAALTGAGLDPSPDLVIPLHDYSIAEARAAITDALAAGLEIDGIFAAPTRWRSALSPVSTTPDCACRTSSSPGSTTSGSPSTSSPA